MKTTCFPANIAPDCGIMNRRTLEELRRSRTKVTSTTGVPILPDNVAGVPMIVIREPLFWISGRMKSIWPRLPRV